MWKFFTAMVLLNAACSFDVSHEVELKGVGVFCDNVFPICTGDDYYCVDVDGNRSDLCHVGCLGAREIECNADTPRCTNTAGDEIIDVPVSCFKN